MSRYYFLYNALPSVFIGVKPELSFQEVKEMLYLNLNVQDLKKVEKLLRPIDLYNIKAHWLSLPMDERGNILGKDLEEALLIRNLPQYLIDFLDRYESEADRLRYFSFLYANFYKESEEYSGFLKKYFPLEREMRLVMAALRAKSKGKDLLREFQFEDPLDPFVQQILSQKDAPEYTPPREYEELREIFEQNRENPQNLNRAILEYRFSKIEEMEENEHFTIDAILAYLAKLIFAEDFANLDFEKGQNVIEELSQYG